jgi:hypothetical protein
MTTAYKLFKVRSNGTIGPLFINARQVIEPGVWLPAEDHPTNGFAHRPGWHATLRPIERTVSSTARSRRAGPGSWPTACASSVA